MFDVKTTADLESVLKSKFQVGDDENKEQLYRYVIYLRRSTDTEDNQQRSIEDQMADCVEFAERLNLRVVKKFEESISAKESGIRPKYREMIDGIQAGKYDGIISYHPNRIARNMREAGEVIDLLDKDIIKDLKFPAYTHTNDASGKMLLGITFVMSKQFSDQLSDVVKRGVRRSIEDGKYINKAKHGYKKDRNGFLRPDGNNFTLICDAFAKRLEGVALEEIAEYLNQKGYTRSNSQTGKTYTAHMSKEKVRRFMKDPVYTGVVLYGENVVDLTELYDFVPAVSVEDFMLINKLEKNSDVIKLAKSFRKSGTVKSDLLRGKVLCSECGEARQAGVTRKKLQSGTRQYFYYRCETEGCRYENKSTRAKVVVDFAKKYFADRPFSNFASYEQYKDEMTRISADRLKETTERIRSKRSELAKAKSRAKDLKAAMVVEKDEEMKVFQKDDYHATLDKVTALKEEIEVLNQKSEAVKDAILTYEEFLELFDNMALLLGKKLKIQQMNNILQKVFLNFSVNRKNVVNYELCEPFASLEQQNSTNVSDGAHSNTTLELFERVVKDHDLLQEWNKEIREFLQQERKQPTIQVTY